MIGLGQVDYLLGWLSESNSALFSKYYDTVKNSMTPQQYKRALALMYQKKESEVIEMLDQIQALQSHE